MAKDTRAFGNRIEPDAYPDKQNHKTKARNVSTVGNGERVAGEIRQYIKN